MALADFPHLKKLNLYGTFVTGDIRDIGDNDFPSLEQVFLPNGVYGGNGCEFQRISDGPDLMKALYLLIKRRPALTMSDWYARKAFNKNWYAKLSKDSPDWYESMPERIRFVEAGCRIGYRWETYNFGKCEVNWLNPGLIVYRQYRQASYILQCVTGRYNVLYAVRVPVPVPVRVQ